MDRGAGILMHVASLPNDYGIGSFGKEAYKFVDFIKKAGFKYWQMLPLGHTGYGDSPYQCFSAFAGNPYFIDCCILEEEGLLKEEEYKNESYGLDRDSIDYGEIFISKFNVLRKAYNNYKKLGFPEIQKKFEEFKKEKSFWLEDYSLYMALKYHFELKGWYKWNEDIKRRTPKAVNAYKERLKDDIDYWSFIQYLFYEQWEKLKNYANKFGIKIIGDIPIYVAEDSVDTWSHPENFKIDKDALEPLVVAGCPPDAFSSTGQLWGNLIYDWNHMKEDDYSWWIMRIKESLKLYDILRIDHFRGFESYWEIPYGERTAINGEWVKGPGIDLFNTIEKKLGKLNIIAEDLGYLTDDVVEFLKESKFPGMRVLQFAFDGKPDNNFLPHRYIKNCIAYTGTHDNDTFLGWYEKTGSKMETKRAKKYLGLNGKEGCNWGFIRGIWASIADVAIAPMQDFLNLGNEARTNLPSTLGINWKWRIGKNSLSDELAKKIYKFTRMYGRCEENE
ncbi:MULTISPECIES: 4-alpha-glucanotransferase [Clostridium]|uniref:4-alpha-glucanotransferase n=1 Tax=Clostridium cibarium TaxID=2762247 RepID=A0ABR8PUH7_9CLOT|nr:MULTISPECIES: 4-alpha-glucanotransferase [Clostridium]MBD7911831.1 4-alpha-glucanotransferase [Clostridium cibarium]